MLLLSMMNKECLYSGDEELDCGELDPISGICDVHLSQKVDELSEYYEKHGFPWAHPTSAD